MGKYFGTDGIRGVANKQLTPELAYKVARAAGYYLKKDLKKGERKTINIAKDTRISGDMIEAALTAAFNSIGIDVNHLGIIPTPAVSYLTDKMDVVAGVMISASHNPIEDNGIKFFDKNGFKLIDKVENEIEEIILKEDNLPRPTHEKIGKMFNKEDKIKDYVNFIINSIKEDLTGIKAVLDCGNGAAYEVAPEILKKLGVDLKIINNEANGSKINVESGSTNPELAAKLVKVNGADIGIAYDGDADRVIFVDEKANIIDGDTIMAICALDMLERNKLKNKTLVTTRYSNLALKEILFENGIKVEIAQNGDRYVLEKMRENDYNLGGEKSGHIIFLDYNKTGDGILTAVQLLSIIMRKNKKLSELSEVMTFWPQKLTNIKVKEKEKLKENKLIEKTISEAEKEIGEKGRVFVRASGTEPIIRLMLEGKNENLLKKWDKKLSEVIKEELN